MFCNFTGGNNFRNIDHREHIADDRFLDFECTSFATEPRVGMRIKRLEHERIFPHALLVKSFLERFDNVFGHSAFGQVIQRLSNDIFPVGDKVICKQLGHVHDFTILVKNHKDGIPCREHNCIENRIFLNAARFIGNQEQIADRAIIFDKELENDLPPGIFTSTATNRDDNLAFAGVHFAAFRHLVDKFLELLRTEELPENLTADVIAFVEKICNVGARMEDIKRIVCEDNSEVVAPQKRFEHRTRADAFIQVFLDEELEKESDNQPGQEYQRQDDKRYDKDDGVQIFLNFGNDFVLLDDMDYIERHVL